MVLRYTLTPPASPRPPHMPEQSRQVRLPLELVVVRVADDTAQHARCLLEDCANNSGLKA